MMQNMDKEESSKPRFRWVKRLLLSVLISVLILGLLAWLFLPRIAEKVMGELLAEADIEQADFTLREIGWDSAVIEDVTLADGIWEVTAKEVKVDYDIFDLFKGRMNLITLSDSSCVVDFSKSQEAGVSEGEATNAENEALSDSAIIHQLPHKTMGQTRRR